MVSTGNNLMKWGILLSMIHIPLLSRFEILPAFVGYFFIMRGVNEICQQSGCDYMQPLKKESIRLFIGSVVYWVVALIFGYFSALNKLVMTVFFLMDILFFGNFLNKTVKYLKEKMRLDEADRLRKIRMSYLKAYLALIVFFMITIIPNGLNYLGIGSTDFLSTVADMLYYIFISLMLLLKLWLSIVVQKYSI